MIDRQGSRTPGVNPELLSPYITGMHIFWSWVSLLLSVTQKKKRRLCQKRGVSTYVCMHVPEKWKNGAKEQAPTEMTTLLEIGGRWMESTHMTSRSYQGRRSEILHLFHVDHTNVLGSPRPL